MDECEKKKVKNMLLDNYICHLTRAVWFIEVISMHLGIFFCGESAVISHAQWVLRTIIMPIHVHGLTLLGGGAKCGR